MSSALPASNVKRLVLENSGEMRISGAAIPIATEAAAAFLRQLGQRAASIARDNGRKTIMEEDINQAKQQAG